MTGLAVLLGPLQGLLGFFQKNREMDNADHRYEEEQRQACLQAMYAALIATMRYQELNQSDRSKELELSQLWATVAIKSRQYFKESLPMFEEKARYWLEQIKWPENVVVERGIDLKTVEAHISRLMRGG